MALFIGALALCWVGTGRVSLWDPDEPRYVVTARNMLATGDYVVPYFNADFRYQKPVFTYWLIALAEAILGDSEFSARFFSGILVAGSCVCTWLMGNRMFGRPAGLIAGTMLALSPTVVFIGRLAIPDGPQLFFSTLCFFTLYEVVRAGQRRQLGLTIENPDQTRRSAFLFWISMGGALLTKGPIVPAMLIASLAVLCCSTRLPFWRLRLRWRVGVLVLSAVVLPWTAAIYYAAGPGFFAEAVGNQIVQRAVRSFDGRFFPPGYYASSLLIGLAPWLSIVLVATTRLWKEARTPGPVSYLFAWSLGSMIVLELFRSKQMHYYAPAYPALVLIAGGYMARVLRGELEWGQSYFERNAAVGTALVGVMFLGTAGFFIWYGPEDARPYFWGVTGIFAAGCITASLLLSRRRLLPSMIALGISSFAGWWVIGGGLMPALEQVRVVRRAGERLGIVQRQTGATSLLLLPIESSLVYYAEKPLEVCDGGQRLIDRIRYCDGEIYSLMADELFAVVNHEIPGRLEIEESWQGWIKMHPGKLHLVRIRGRRENPENADAAGLRFPLLAD